MSTEILRVLRSIAEGDEYARLYKWVNLDALFVEKVLRENHATKLRIQRTAFVLGIVIGIGLGAEIAQILFVQFGCR